MITVPLPEIIGDFQYAFNSFALSGTPLLICKTDSTRYSVMLKASGVGSCIVSPTSSKVITTGFVIESTANIFIVTFRDSPMWVTGEIYCTVLDIGTFINVYETFYRPKVQQ